MPDLEEVSNTLVAMIAALLANDDGTPKNGAHTSVFAGWPVPNDLKAALAAGHVCVSVYPMPGATSNVTRHIAEWELKTPSVITTTAAVAGNAITFGGTITLPLNVGVHVGCVQAAYAARAGDTLDALAAGVAAALSAEGIAAASSGPTLIIGIPEAPTVALGSRAVYWRKSIQIKQVYNISIWSPSPALRKATVAAFVGNLFAEPRITLTDDTIGILLFQRETISDHSELENLYRRDVFASVEYCVMETTDAWDVVVATKTTEVVADI